MKWSNKLAYAVGLITTDGNLSKDGRHLSFVSKDLEQIKNFCQILNLRCNICLKKSGYANKNKYYFVQFSNVKFYTFLTKLGLHPNKSKSLSQLTIPDSYFADFLRGCLDGDGFTYSYWDKRWKSSYMFYLGFTSASMIHLIWLSDTINRLFHISGAINKSGNAGHQLRFAKKSSLTLVEKIYYSDEIICLSRKREKIKKCLYIISKQSRDGEMVDAHV